MSNCCSKKKNLKTKLSACSRLKSPLSWFNNMTGNCYEYARKAKKKSNPVVGIMCEYTPRELIMAADGVPVCLCGGSIETIASAEETLPSNLCPLIKSTFGYHIQKTNPYLEMADLIVAETTCDGKKKMYELMAESRPMYVLELPQKSSDKDAFKHWVLELRKFKNELEKRFKKKITDAKIKEAIKVMNQERSLRRQLAELMKNDCPPMTGRQLLDLKSIISGIPKDLKEYKKVLGLLPPQPNQLSDGEKEKKIRVLLTGVPLVHGAERVLEIIENHGGLIVCQENCTGIKPILENVDETLSDPVYALAKKYFNLHCSVMTKNTRRLDILRQLVKEYKPDCVIELIWQACLTYDIESFYIKRLCREELNIPYLKIETDYSPSDSARIAVRIEALFETIKLKK